MSTRVTRSSLKRQAEQLITKDTTSAKTSGTQHVSTTHSSPVEKLPRIPRRVKPKKAVPADKIPPQRKRSEKTKVHLQKLKTSTEISREQSPGVSKTVANKPPITSLAPTILPPALVPQGTSRDTLLAEACAHFIAVDPRFESLIQKYPCSLFSPKGLAEIMDPFTALASSIISQQISGAAAATIQKRFIALVHSLVPLSTIAKSDLDLTTELPFPTPAQVAVIDIPTLRQPGLSLRKAEFVQGLASKFVSGELSVEMLAEADYEEVAEKLIAVRGLGRWSVEMFACFGLKRIDVFSTGDLSVQKAMAIFQGKDVSKSKAKSGKWKYMSEQEMLDLSSKFAPYRSLFMWYMWRVLLE